VLQQHDTGQEHIGGHYGPFGFGNSNGQNVGTLIQNNLIGILNPKESPGYKPISGNFEAAEKSNNHEWNGDPNAPSNPRFTSLNTFDLTLAANSPAKDAGKLITAITRDGISVPAFNDAVTGAAPDLGAYEIGTPRWKAGYTPVAQ
jgi:hypothetical protein